VWDINTGMLICVLDTHARWITALAMSGNGRRVCTGAYDGSLKVWDIDTGYLLAVFYAEHTIKDFAMTSDITTIIAGNAFGNVHLLHLEGVD
jgi:WD40 repeat protein